LVVITLIHPIHNQSEVTPVAHPALDLLAVGVGDVNEVTAPGFDAAYGAPLGVVNASSRRHLDAVAIA